VNLQRYFIAGTLSLTVHIAMFWSATENKAYAIPIGTTSSAVSVNFAAVKPAGSKNKAAQAPPEKRATAEKQQAVTQQPQKKNSDKKVVKRKAEKQPTVKSAVETVKNSEIADALPMKPLEAMDTMDSQQSSAPVLAGSTEKAVLVEAPRFLSPPAAPHYPRLAKRKGIEGTVTYEIWLDEQGRQIKLTLKDSSGTPLLDRAALQAIEKWKFSPHKINGQAIAQRVLIPIKFKLD